MEHYGSGYSNWGHLLLEIINEPIEIILIGIKFERNKILPLIKPNVIICYHTDIPMSKFHERKGIYICVKGSCSAPTQDYKSVYKTLSEVK
jgi:hypothetical protein